MSMKTALHASHIIAFDGQQHRHLENGTAARPGEKSGLLCRDAEFTHIGWLIRVKQAMLCLILSLS